MVPGRESGDVHDAALTWADDIGATEWLTDPMLEMDDPVPWSDGPALEWLTGASELVSDASGVDEAEFLPVLAAVIPALISAAPAIISAIQQLTSKPKPPVSTPRPAQTAPPPTTVRPQPTPAQSTRPAPALPGAPTEPPPVSRSVSGTSVAQPAPSGTVDVLQQLAALLPHLSDLVTRPRGREWLISSERDYAEQREHAAEPRGTSQRVVPERAPKPVGPSEDGSSERGETGSGDETTGRSPPEPAAAILATPRRSSARLVSLPDRTLLNVGVSACPTSLLVARFGTPRDLVTHECQAITSPFWEGRMATGQIGAFRARGHRQAVALFRDAFAALEQADPKLQARTGLSGMLCVRHVRGRPDVLSNHALGLALDVTLDGHVDIRGDGQVQEGLITLHSVFSRFGIFWGAGLRPEDAVHFEVGAEVVHRWIDEGVF